MNEIVNNFLLAGNKFMPEMHVRQHVLWYNHWKQRKNKKIKETGDSKYIYENKLDNLVFNMIWLMEILKIYIEKHYLIKY